MEEARKITKSFQTTVILTKYAMKAHHPHCSMKNGVIMLATITILYKLGQAGHCSLASNPALAAIANHLKQQTSVVGMPRATPQAFGPQFLRHRATISSLAT